MRATGTKPRVQIRVFRGHEGIVMWKSRRSVGGDCGGGERRRGGGAAIVALYSLLLVAAVRGHHAALALALVTHQRSRANQLHLLRKVRWQYQVGDEPPPSRTCGSLGGIGPRLEVFTIYEGRRGVDGPRSTVSWSVLGRWLDRAASSQRNLVRVRVLVYAARPDLPVQTLLLETREESRRRSDE